MKIKNDGFYERYKKEQKAKVKEKQMRKKYNISDDKVVIIQEKSKLDKFVVHISNIVAFIFKSIIYMLILVLSSIGATVVINESLRAIFIELLSAIV
ncbi:MAG: hypothetical protein J6A89_01220 [Clostridia bacterium]|nr:hypothetical protein [Clostridia bacterium]